LIRNFHGSDSALIRLLLGKDHVTEMTYWNRRAPTVPHRLTWLYLKMPYPGGAIFNLIGYRLFTACTPDKHGPIESSFFLKVTCSWVFWSVCPTMWFSDVPYSMPYNLNVLSNIFWIMYWKLFDAFDYRFKCLHSDHWRTRYLVQVGASSTRVLTWWKIPWHLVGTCLEWRGNQGT
jgi:hypothetical protein